MKDRTPVPMENGMDSSSDMERAFPNIYDEIMEYIIEGLCFEVHRAVRLGYFSVQDYCIRDGKVEVYEEEPITVSEGGDIFGYVDKHPQTTTCPICNQRKGLKGLGRHMLRCKAKTDDNANCNINGKREENLENKVEDRSKSDGNDSVERIKTNGKKQTKSTPNYESMSPEQIKDFLDRHCGVISKRTNKPCSNKLSCNIHVPEDRNEVRGIYLGSFSNGFEGGDIDMDTAD